MIFETIKSDGLAHLSYLIGDGSSGVSAVIDPRRDIDVYLELAQKHQARISHVLETHVHADFVSGSRELAARTGAPIYTGASDDYGFSVEALRDGDVLEVGSLRFRVLHTPGHSPEHVCFVVKGGGQGAEEDWAVFTGDTLFAGEVGRPDLAGADSTETLAAALYHSLHDKLLSLDDGLEVYPAHGHGSPCGGSIGVRDRTTIGYERRHNGKLQLKNEAEFVKRVLTGLSEEPFYYSRMKELNARGPEVIGALPYVPALSPREFREEAENALVVDAREIAAFAGAHLEGSLSIALRTSFPIWAGWLLDPSERILLVLEDAAQLGTAQRHLLRIGVENIGGYLRQGMRGWTQAGLPFRAAGRLSVHELRRMIEGGKELQVLDVRRDDEWESGHIPTARHAYLPFLSEHLDELAKDEPVAVYCGSGYRSSIAVSLLKRHGFADVSNVLGSMSAWKAAGYDLEKPR